MDDIENNTPTHKDDLLEQQLKKIYFCLSDKKTQIEEKENNIFILKKFLDDAQGYLYSAYLIKIGVDKPNVIQKFIDSNLIILLMDLLKEDLEEDAQVGKIILVNNESIKSLRL